ncbi:hypothetical protein MRQ36_01940 [Micromonospora sp. R77]|uniref:hypothetical protein n=1 Tax=Micromonospora sp. R77 TaxID=2925836 RepID=UPI001F5FF977|nr:hypothetical protein [Micromonospora sp. R77]MCI4061402.1 hypothetical protein [Micromonospora sp. R77]
MRQLAAEWREQGDRLTTLGAGVSKAYHATTWRGLANFYAEIATLDVELKLKQVKDSAYEFAKVLDDYADEVQKQIDKERANLIVEIVLSFLDLLTMGLGAVLFKALAILADVLAGLVTAMGTLASRIVTALFDFAINALVWGTWQVVLEFSVRDAVSGVMNVPVDYSAMPILVNVFLASILGGLFSIRPAELVPFPRTKAGGGPGGFPKPAPTRKGDGTTNGTHAAGDTLPRNNTVDGTPMPVRDAAVSATDLAPPHIPDVSPGGPTSGLGDQRVHSGEGSVGSAGRTVKQATPQPAPHTFENVTTPATPVPPTTATRQAVSGGGPHVGAPSRPGDGTFTGDTALPGGGVMANRPPKVSAGDGPPVVSGAARPPVVAASDRPVANLDRDGTVRHSLRVDTGGGTVKGEAPHPGGVASRPTDQPVANLELGRSVSQPTRVVNGEQFSPTSLTPSQRGSVDLVAGRSDVVGQPPPKMTVGGPEVTHAPGAPHQPGRTAVPENASTITGPTRALTPESPTTPTAGQVPTTVAKPEVTTLPTRSPYPAENPPASPTQSGRVTPSSASEWSVSAPSTPASSVVGVPTGLGRGHHTATSGPAPVPHGLSLPPAMGPRPGATPDLPTGTHPTAPVGGGQVRSLQIEALEGPSGVASGPARGGEGPAAVRGRPVESGDVPVRRAESAPPAVKRPVDSGLVRAPEERFGALNAPSAGAPTSRSLLDRITGLGSDKLPEVPKTEPRAQKFDELNIPAVPADMERPKELIEEFGAAAGLPRREIDELLDSYTRHGDAILSKGADAAVTRKLMTDIGVRAGMDEGVARNFAERATSPNTARSWAAHQEFKAEIRAFADDNRRIELVVDWRIGRAEEVGVPYTQAVRRELTQAKRTGDDATEERIQSELDRAVAFRAAAEDAASERVTAELGRRLEQLGHGRADEEAVAASDAAAERAAQEAFAKDFRAGPLRELKSRVNVENGASTAEAMGLRTPAEPTRVEPPVRQRHDDIVASEEEWARFQRDTEESPSGLPDQPSHRDQLDELLASADDLGKQAGLWPKEISRIQAEVQERYDLTLSLDEAKRTLLENTAVRAGMDPDRAAVFAARDLDGGLGGRNARRVYRDELAVLGVDNRLYDEWVRLYADDFERFGRTFDDAVRERLTLAYRQGDEARIREITEPVSIGRDLSTMRAELNEHFTDIKLEMRFDDLRTPFDALREPAAKPVPPEQAPALTSGELQAQAGVQKAFRRDVLPELHAGVPLKPSPGPKAEPSVSERMGHTDEFSDSSSRAQDDAFDQQLQQLDVPEGPLAREELPAGLDVPTDSGLKELQIFGRELAEDAGLDDAATAQLLRDIEDRWGETLLRGATVVRVRKTLVEEMYARHDLTPNKLRTQDLAGGDAELRDLARSAFRAELASARLTTRLFDEFAALTIPDGEGLADDLVASARSRLAEAYRKDDWDGVEKVQVEISEKISAVTAGRHADELAAQAAVEAKANRHTFGKVIDDLGARMKADDVTPLPGKQNRPESVQPEGPGDELLMAAPLTRDPIGTPPTVARVAPAGGPPARDTTALTPRELAGNNTDHRNLADDVTPPERMPVDLKEQADVLRQRFAALNGPSAGPAPAPARGVESVQPEGPGDGLPMAAPLSRDPIDAPPTVTPAVPSGRPPARDTTAPTPQELAHRDIEDRVLAATAAERDLHAAGLDADSRLRAAVAEFRTANPGVLLDLDGVLAKYAKRIADGWRNQPAAAWQGAVAAAAAALPGIIERAVRDQPSDVADEPTVADAEFLATLDTMRDVGAVPPAIRDLLGDRWVGDPVRLRQELEAAELADDVFTRAVDVVDYDHGLTLPVSVLDRMRRTFTAEVLRHHDAIRHQGDDARFAEDGGREAVWQAYAQRQFDSARTDLFVAGKAWAAAQSAATKFHGSIGAGLATAPDQSLSEVSLRVLGQQFAVEQLALNNQRFHGLEDLQRQAFQEKLDALRRPVDKIAALSDAERAKQWHRDANSLRVRYADRLDTALLAQRHRPDLVRDFDTALAEARAETERTGTATLDGLAPGILDGFRADYVTIGRRWFGEVFAPAIDAGARVFDPMFLRAEAEWRHQYAHLRTTIRQEAFVYLQAHRHDEAVAAAVAAHRDAAERHGRPIPPDSAYALAVESFFTDAFARLRKEVREQLDPFAASRAAHWDSVAAEIAREIARHFTDARLREYAARAEAAARTDDRATARLAAPPTAYEQAALPVLEAVRVGVGAGLHRDGRDVPADVRARIVGEVEAVLHEADAAARARAQRGNGTDIAIAAAVAELAERVAGLPGSVPGRLLHHEQVGSELRRAERAFEDLLATRDALPPTVVKDLSIAFAHDWLTRYDRLFRGAATAAEAKAVDTGLRLLAQQTTIEAPNLDVLGPGALRSALLDAGAALPSGVAPVASGLLLTESGTPSADVMTTIAQSFLPIAGKQRVIVSPGVDLARFLTEVTDRVPDPAQRAAIVVHAPSAPASVLGTLGDRYGVTVAYTERPADERQARRAAPVAADGTPSLRRWADHWLVTPPGREPETPYGLRRGDHPDRFELPEGWTLEDLPWGLWARPAGSPDPELALRVRSGAESGGALIVVGEPGVAVPAAVARAGLDLIGRLPVEPGQSAVHWLSPLPEQWRDGPAGAASATQSDVTAGGLSGVRRGAVERGPARDAVATLGFAGHLDAVAAFLSEPDAAARDLLLLDLFEADDAVRGALPELYVGLANPARSDVALAGVLGYAQTALRGGSVPAAQVQSAAEGLLVGTKIPLMKTLLGLAGSANANRAVLERFAELVLDC